MLIFNSIKLPSGGCGMKTEIKVGGGVSRGMALIYLIVTRTKTW